MILLKSTFSSKPHRKAKSSGYFFPNSSVLIVSFSVLRGTTRGGFSEFKICGIKGKSSTPVVARGKPISNATSAVVEAILQRDMLESDN